MLNYENLYLQNTVEAARKHRLTQVLLSQYPDRIDIVNGFIRNDELILVVKRADGGRISVPTQTPIIDPTAKAWIAEGEVFSSTGDFFLCRLLEVHNAQWHGYMRSQAERSSPPDTNAIGVLSYLEDS